MEYYFTTFRLGENICTFIAEDDWYKYLCLFSNPAKFSLYIMLFYHMTIMLFSEIAHVINNVMTTRV